MAMLENKPGADGKLKPSPASYDRNAHIRQLQDEIDRLALLVNEAKRQSDRIQAAADAIGDAVFQDGGQATILPFAVPDKRSRRRTDA